jgi:hypothetical protein
VRHDIGEALDFGIGPLERGGPGVDELFQIFVQETQFAARYPQLLEVLADKPER